MNLEENKTNIYVLKLKDNKYYVGKSQNVAHRLMEHSQGHGAAWTKKYPLLDIIAVYCDCDEFDEDKYVKKYMLKYGIDNVRGGAYCQILMSDQQYDFLKRELWHSQDQCIRCGKIGHFSDTCPLNAKVVSKSCEKCGSNEHTTRDCVNVLEDEDEIETIIPECHRCGRDDHVTEDCTKFKHVNGNFLKCQVCKNYGHAKHNCRRYRNGNDMVVHECSDPEQVTSDTVLVVNEKN